MSLEKENFHPSIFIHVSRTGGTAAKHAVPFIKMSYANYSGEHYTYLGCQKYLGSVNSKLSNYFTFSIIRNQLERLVSLWSSNNRGSTKDAQILGRIMPGVEDKIPFKDYAMNLQNIENDYEPIDNISSEYLNCMCSYDLLKDENGHVSLNYLLYNKTLHQDIVNMLNEVKNTDHNYTLDDVTMPVRGSHAANGTTPSDKNYIDFYDDESLKFAKKYYEKDFDHFDTYRW